jgi:hypothetical protein
MGLLDGAKAILDGFGEAPPSHGVAQARADICSGRLSGRPCPANHRGGWIVTDKIAQVIRAQRERKLELNLRVEGEELLGQCTACRCPLFLKVFYDEETIYSYTPDTVFDKMKEANEACWMLAIQQRHQNK